MVLVFSRLLKLFVAHHVAYPGVLCVHALEMNVSSAILGYKNYLFFSH